MQNILEAKERKGKMKSYYYQDERLTIIQHDGLYDIYDTKVKGRLKCKDATKQMAEGQNLS